MISLDNTEEDFDVGPTAMRMNDLGIVVTKGEKCISFNWQASLLYLGSRQTAKPSSRYPVPKSHQMIGTGRCGWRAEMEERMMVLAKRWTRLLMSCDVRMRMTSRTVLASSLGRLTTNDLHSGLRTTR